MDILYEKLKNYPKHLKKKNTKEFLKKIFHYHLIKKMIYDLSIHLNTDIDISHNKGNGKLTVSYDNQNELERIFNLIQSMTKKNFNNFFILLV